MSLAKAIEHGKEWRNPRRKMDDRCNPGGGCERCRNGRYHKHTKRELTAREQMKEERYAR